MTEPTSIPIKSSRKTRDWTSSRILSNLLSLSWPMIVMESTYMVSQIFDMFWVSKAGSASIAAIGIAGLIPMIVSVLDIALLSGGRAMISRFIGAGDQEGAHKTAAQLYIMAFCWGLVISIAGYLFADKLIGLFGVGPDVASEALKYMRVVFLGWIAMEMLIMGLYIMQSAGDSLNPMILEIIMRVIHVSLSPFLVLGIWIFPALGITGAALSSVISQIIGAGIGFFLLFTGRTRIRLKLSDFKFIPNLSWRILKIGAPNLISMGQMSVVNLITTKLIIPFGTFAIAAHGLVGNIFGFVQAVNAGMGRGVGVLVGQNLGAKKPEQSVKTAWLGAAILQGFSLVFGAVILIWAEELVLIFSKDPSLVGIGALFLRISTIGLLVNGFSSAFNSCIGGAGDTLPNMIINIGMIWLIQIPLAIVFSNYTSIGVTGVRWAMTASTIIGALATYVYFQTGRWKRKKV